MTCSNEQQTQHCTRWPESHHKSGSQSSETPAGAGSRAFTRATKWEYCQYIDYNYLNELNEI